VSPSAASKQLGQLTTPAAEALWPVTTGSRTTNRPPSPTLIWPWWRCWGVQAAPALFSNPAELSGNLWASCANQPPSLPEYRTLAAAGQQRHAGRVLIGVGGAAAVGGDGCGQDVPYGDPARPAQLVTQWSLESWIPSGRRGRWRSPTLGNIASELRKHRPVSTSRRLSDTDVCEFKSHRHRHHGLATNVRHEADESPKRARPRASIEVGNALVRVWRTSVPARQRCRCRCGAVRVGRCACQAFPGHACGPLSRWRGGSGVRAVGRLSCGP